MKNIKNINNTFNTKTVNLMPRFDNNSSPKNTTGKKTETAIDMRNSQILINADGLPLKERSSAA